MVSFFDLKSKCKPSHFRKKTFQATFFAAKIRSKIAMGPVVAEIFLAEHMFYT